VKPFRLLIPLMAACLLLVSARESRSAVQGLAPEVTPPRVWAQPNAPMGQAFFLFHPRFYKEYGARGLSSTLYVQNPNETSGTYTLDFYDCDSGDHLWFADPWTIAPHETQVAGPDDFGGLDPGCYGLVMASDVNLAYASVVEDAWSGGSATDKLATHTGFAEEEAGSNLRFGPFLRGEVNSTVVVWNIGRGGTAAVTATAYDESGSQILLPPCTADPYAECTYLASDLTKSSTPFTGTLVIQSIGGSVVGIMALNSTSGDVNEYRKPLVAGATGACLPRVFKHVNEGGVVRSTTLFVANSGAGSSDVTLVFYDSNGVPAENASQDFNLEANGSRYLELKEVDDLPSGAWSVCASGELPLAMEELTREDSPVTSPASSATHGVTGLGSSDTLAVTHLTRNDASYTAFSVQNIGLVAADVDLKYYDISGALVHTDSVNLPPKGWARFNQSTQSELKHGYSGSPVLSSNQPLVSLVDEYAPPSRIYLPFVLR
jgi:hypothetical protein